MAKKPSLGRGLDGMLPKKNSEPKAEQAPIIQEIKIEGAPLMVPVENISKNPDQPRRDFNEKELKNLSESISNSGIIEPLIVRKIDDTKFEIIAGERRFRAAKLAGLKEVPVIIRKLSDDPKEKLLLALYENIFRENLNAIEEAEAFQKLEKNFGQTHQQIAEAMSRDRSSVTNTLRLLKLPRHIQDDIRFGRITQGHGRAMTALIDQSKMDDLRSDVITKNLTVRQTEALVKKLNKKPENIAQGFEKNLGEKAYFDELAKSFTNSLGGLKVKINHEGSQKRLEIYYNSNDDLELLMHKMGAKSVS